MFFCAWSITASRSLSFCRLSTVCSRVVVIDWLRWCVTESSRSLTARCSSAWRPASMSRMASMPHRGLRLQPRQLDHLRVGRLLIAPAQRPHGEHDQRGERRKPGQQIASAPATRGAGCRSSAPPYIDSDHKNKK